MTNVISRIATPPAFLVPASAAAAPWPAPASPGFTEEDFLYEPMVDATRPTFQRAAVAARVSTSTIAAWAYVPVPLLAVPLLLGTPDLTSSSALSIPGVALLGVMVIALGVLAAVDHTQLRRRGVFNAPSGLVGVLPPVFIIGRTVRVGRSGAAIASASLMVQAAVVALFVWRVLPILA